MKCLYLTVLTISMLVFAAYAQPIPEKGTEMLCRGYEETVEGVWLDGGKEVLRFRFASNRDAKGCYATLNTYSAWGATTPAEFELNLVQWKQTLRDAQSVTVDLATGEAHYNFGGATAVGRLVSEN